MGVRGILVSFDEDASPNGAAGFKSWLQGMIDFHLPNMAVALTITEGPDVPSRTALTAAQMWHACYPLPMIADRVWQDFKDPNKKIAAIKEFRTLTGVGLKESKDQIDNAERRAR